MHLVLLAFFILMSRMPSPARPNLVVDWWTSADLAAVARSKPTCDEPGGAMQLEAELMVCDNRDPALDEKAIQRPHCAAKASRILPLDLKGTVSFEGVPRGTHFVRFKVGDAPELWQVVRVFDGEPARASAELRWFSFFGKVTRKGAPQHVQLYGTVTDPQSGEYVAYLPRDPQAYAQRIAPCTQGGPQYTFVPEEGPKENARYDIEIPANRVVVEVVDSATSQPIAGARVRHSAIKDEKNGAAHYATNAGKTDDKGVAVVEPLVPKQLLMVCAEQDRYERRCTETFRLAADETKTVRLALDPVIRREGRVFASGRIEIGQVYWYAPTGELRESVYIEEDGRFAYKRAHAPGEIVVFTAPTHPLFAFVMPRLEDDQPFNIQLPQARVRSVQVHLAPTASESAFFTIALGDLIVPGNPLSPHLARRGHSVTLLPGATTTIADIYETAPLAVIVAPASFAQGRARSGFDMFLTPEARSLARKVVGEAGRVTFE